jgi:hypothetical protein
LTANGARRKPVSEVLMRIMLGAVVASLMVLAGCKGSTASVDDCVAKFMSQNSGSGDAEKKLFTGVCGGLTPEQRGCVVKASSKDDLDKCAPTGK